MPVGFRPLQRMASTKPFNPRGTMGDQPITRYPIENELEMFPLGPENENEGLDSAPESRASSAANAPPTPAPAPEPEPEPAPAPAPAPELPAIESPQPHRRVKRWVHLPPQWKAGAGLRAVRGAGVELSAPRELAIYCTRGGRGRSTALVLP